MVEVGGGGEGVARNGREGASGGSGWRCEGGSKGGYLGISAPMARITKAGGGGRVQMKEGEE